MKSLISVPHLQEASRKIYVASSWRNQHYPQIVDTLRNAGHEVFDFRNTPHTFRWQDVHPGGATTIESYLECLMHPRALAGFESDKEGLDWADTCVLVLPCGRSAHMEAGYAAGQGKRVIFWLHEDCFEPELMYLLGNDFVSAHD